MKRVKGLSLMPNLSAHTHGFSLLRGTNSQHKFDRGGEVGGYDDRYMQFLEFIISIGITVPGTRSRHGRRLVRFKSQGQIHIQRRKNLEIIYP